MSRGQDYGYQSAGRYWRIGVDKNMAPQLPDGHVVSVGFRYARSRFDEELTYAGSTWRNDRMTAAWLELTAGIKVRLWRQLFMGYQLRLKSFKRLSEEQGAIQTYDIPGFGRNKKSGQSVRNGAVGFSYYVYWTIPFREKQVSVRQPY